jgi:hypothetical protein
VERRLAFVRRHSSTGALVFDLNSQEWTRLSSEMPSRMVLSITGDDKYVYFGTTAGIARIGQKYWTQNR